jgi:hypothetical protein
MSYTNELLKIYDFYPNKEWNYFELSKNPNITWDLIQNYLDKPWDYSMLSLNPNINWDIIRFNPDKPWDYYYLSKNINITWDIVKNNPDKPWDYSMLSLNPNINWDIIRFNPDKPWDYYYLSKNINITWDIVKNNFDKPWNYNLLSFIYLKKFNSSIYNINSYINNYPIYNINSDLIKFNCFTDDIDIYYIKYNQHNINYLIQYSNIKYDILINIIHHCNEFLDDKEIYYYMLSEYSYITLNDVIKYEDYIFFNALSKNKFNYDYYLTTYYKKQLVNNFINKCKEELINKVCTPKRILNWNEDVLLNNDHPLYNLTQNDINKLL